MIERHMSVEAPYDTASSALHAARCWSLSPDIYRLFTYKLYRNIVIIYTHNFKVINTQNNLKI